MNWLELMEREGAFSETEGDRLVPAYRGLSWMS